MRSRLSILAVLFALVGCAPSNPGIEIEGIMALGTDCSASAQATGPFVGSPILDTSPDFSAVRIGGIRYAATVQLVNRMLNRANEVYPIMADTNTYFVREAEVELQDVGGEALDLDGLPARFRVPASGLIPSAGSATEYGRGLAVIELVPSVYGDALAGRSGTILATVRITGTTSGDSTQTTGEYTIPLQLCNGCLFACGEDESGMAAAQLACRPGQDGLSLIPCP